MNKGYRFNVYLAGKISHGDWRHETYKDLRGADLGNDEEPKHPVVDGTRYIGPYFISCDHGCFHGEGTHDPVSKSGTNDMSNLITSCSACNRGKSDREIITPDLSDFAESPF